MSFTETYEVVTTTMGVKSIRHRALNEIMHNPLGPSVESDALYIQQSRLEEHLKAGGAEPLCLYDVGLGAAGNAVAAIRCARKILGPRRPLYIVSFERELELLRFALRESEQLSYLEGFAEPLMQLVETGQWQEPGLIWELRHGDFLRHLASERTAPELIYYDPYSPNVETTLWTLESFKQLRAKCGENTRLYTYSQATPVRVGLLLAGFFVGRGRPMGPREETTEAAVRCENLREPLDLKWWGRWSRSRAQCPYDFADHAETIRAQLLQHPQFIGQVT